MKTKRESLELLKTCLKRVDVLKVDIAKKRDQLREAVGEVEAIVESMDGAVEGLEEGARNFSDAVDTLSQHL